MNPDRWRRIEELCHAAGARVANEREAFLDEACGDDAELRREVESLLAEESRAERFLHTSPWRAPALAPGTRLGPHEILSLIGAGGMGEVYKARDTRLDRIVALKILPPEVSSDPDRRTRFAREAKTISQLNHPHICTLHDIGEAPAPSPAPDGVGAGFSRPNLSEGVGAGFSRPNLQYLVMEYLEGETLAARLARGVKALPLPEALRMGAEIAEALAAAHKHGVVHRDLKPGNVMLVGRGGPSGPPTVKLLDFGLAKLKAHGERPVVGSGGPSGPPILSQATDCEPLTARGMILGTLPYMAPEQLEGKRADARTDLWALGTILYEMLTGTRAFEGESSATLIGAILEREPESLAARQPLTPPALDRLVRKCLAKAPDDRWDSAHDVADELRWIRETSGVSGTAGPLVSAARGRRGLLLAGLAAAALLLVVAGAAVTWTLARPAQPPPPAVQRLLIDTRPAEGLLGPHPDERSGAFARNRPSRTAIALSPDGTTLVFSGVQGDRQQLYRRRLAESVAVPLDGTEGAENPFFSPDGAWIGFWAREALWKVRLDGGPPIELCASPPISGASWGSRDTIAFGRTPWLLGISAVPAAGGAPKAISAVDTARGELRHAFPHFLPDGETLLFTTIKDWIDPRSASIAAVSLTTGAHTTIVDGAMDARYLPTGHLVYVRLGRLEAAPFDPARVAVTGEAVGLIPDVMQALNSGSGGIDTGAAQVTTAGTGTLVYVAGGMLADRRSDFVWVDHRGAIVEALPIPPGPYSMPRLSPDGRRFLYVRSGVSGSLWYYDLARQGSTMIPITEPQVWDPIWLPDGQRAVFCAPPGGYTRLHTVPVDGSARSTPVGGEVPANVSECPGSWTPDGKTLVFTREESGSGQGTAIWLLRMDGGLPRRSALLEPPAAAGGTLETAARQMSWPAVSPDGRWLAYVSNASGRNEVYVQRFPERGGRQQVSRDGGRAPLWRRDGRELFYLTERTPRKMMAVDVRLGPAFTAGLPRVLFEVPEALHTGTALVPAYDVSLDGQRFLFVRRFTEPIPRPPSQMHVVFNWFEELKAKVPVR